MSNVRLSETDSGRLVVLHVGDELTLELPENQTTGFLWDVEGGGEPVVRLVTSRYEAPGATAAAASEPGTRPEPGRAGARRIVFAANAPGRAQVRLKYWRDFSGSVDRRVEFPIEVRE